MPSLNFSHSVLFHLYHYNFNSLNHVCTFYTLIFFSLPYYLKYFWYRYEKKYYISKNKVHNTAYHFMHYSECLSIPILFYGTPIINPFLIQGSQPIMIKGRDFSQWWNPYTLYCSSSVKISFKIGSIIYCYHS